MHLVLTQWGRHFLEINAELLAKYAACRDSSHVVQVQNEHLSQLELERSRRAAEIDLPPAYSSSSSSSSDDDAENDNSDPPINQ